MTAEACHVALAMLDKCKDEWHWRLTHTALSALLLNVNVTEDETFGEGIAA